MREVVRDSRYGVHAINDIEYIDSIILKRHFWDSRLYKIVLISRKLPDRVIANLTLEDAKDLLEKFNTIMKGAHVCGY